MDLDSSEWLIALADAGTKRNAALARLHEMLLRFAVNAIYRRGSAFRLGRRELEDLAHEVVSDAMVALLKKLDTFRWESRFTTWAYRFVGPEVSNKLGCYFWPRPLVSLDVEVEDWERLPAPFPADPLVLMQQRELNTAMQRAMNETLTGRQRYFFVAIVVDGVPMETVVSQSGSNRGAIYKTIFDARRKIRAYLTANRCLEKGSTAPAC